MTHNALLERLTRHYLSSRDFNGLAVGDATPIVTVRELIERGLVSLNRGDQHLNPHIKAFEAESIDEQLRKIDTHGLEGCIYPERVHLEKIVDAQKYGGRPFTLRLALGEPQLSFLPFDPMVLEQYRNDPRYYFNVDDVHGMISVSDEHFGKGSLRERDEVLLQSFGFAYDPQMNRALAVFLRYLHNLTPEHQQIWEARRLEGEFELHPDYHRASIIGDFPTHVPIFVAFAEELQQVNELCALMGRPPLFRRVFKDAERPREFAFLLRPTLKALNEFVLALDKAMSDNIDVKFFGSDVSLEHDKPRADGKVVVERKGTIQILDEWLNRVHSPNPGPRETMIATFRKVRKLRQKPAHAVDEDRFDAAYFQQQRNLILDAFNAVRTLRLILENHPATNGHEVPDWLREGRVRGF